MQVLNAKAMNIVFCVLNEFNKNLNCFNVKKKKKQRCQWVQSVNGCYETGLLSRGIWSEFLEPINEDRWLDHEREVSQEKGSASIDSISREIEISLSPQDLPRGTQDRYRIHLKEHKRIWIHLAEYQHHGFHLMDIRIMDPPRRRQVM